MSDTPAPPSAGRRALKIACIVAVLAALIVAGRQVGGELPRFAEWVKGLGALGPIVFIAGYAVLTVAFVPGSLLTLAAGAVFGPWWGTLWVLLGATLGATLAFLVARHVARAPIERRLAGNARFAAIDSAVGRQGFRMVLLLRLSPVFPFNLLNYGLGLTRVRLRDYVLASVGMIPGTLLYVYQGKVAGDALALAGGASSKGLADWLLLGGGLLATVAVTWMITRAARAALKEATAGAEGEGVDPTTERRPELPRRRAMSNPLLGLNALGQSPWYDNISRSLLQSGALAKLVAEDGIRGLTSNPAIFEKAIAGSADYDEAIAALLAGASLDPMGLYEALAIEDIRAAADLLAGVYKSSGGRDGFVSLEVSPYLAADTEGTIAEARRLWKTVARPNVMIKIPGTPEGMPAIRAVLADGISVNVTLLFSIEAYRAAAEAHVAALEDRVANGLPVTGVSSVASFFISRIDSLVDSKLEQVAQSTPERREQALNLRGKAAIANAKLAHDAWVALIVSPRWQALADAGAFSQRLLWASTSTKNPTYRDVMYVEQLIGPDTVNTMPAPTVEAFRDHGEVRATLGEGKDEARATMFAIAQVGVDFASVTQTLLDDAVRLFADPFDSLLGALARKRQQVLGTRLASQTLRLPPELDASVKALQDEWRKAGKVRRLWARDASLWTGGDEARWLGWLDLVELGLAQCDDLQNFSRDVKTGGFDDAVLLGMGGSSLGPEVLAATLSTAPGHPRLRVLDSTDPAQVLAVEAAVDLSRTLFLVASKSGSTLEPEILRARFFAAVTEQVGAKEAGRRFVAVTDPGSQLEATARRDGWRKIFHGLPSVGGRYSILSAFGLVPAAVMGVPLRRMLESARLMAQSSAASAPPAGNPAVTLGLLLGASAQAGRDKLTVLASPGLAHVGAWLEQLVAESTGKQGIGIVPVDGERVGAPEVYGNDRLFVHLRLSSDDDAAQDAKIAALAAAGHPVVRLELAEALDIAQEFFRFEIATAVAGAVLGIHPFDQPDVEASKIRTKELTTAWERDAQFPSEGEPIASGGGARFFAPDKDATELQALAQGSRDATDMLAAHLARLRAGDYFAVLAYVPMSEATEAPLQALRHAVRDARKVATCLGFGPRFLHSTGQAYKGGPPSGVFLQVTCDDAQDAEIPGRKASFGVVKAAQARGDMEVLVERGRRVLRVHLPADITAALAWLREAVRTAAKRGAE